MHKVVHRFVETDIYQHLAAEEMLMNELAPDTCILLLWRSADCVVIGKNQNPWLEVSLSDLQRDGTRLARRLSGGGAVFHDLGNLNFSFILWQDAYDRDALAETVVAAVRSLGIDANVGERHILESKGRKFSGNAFCIRRKKVIHHGTLLVDADLERLSRYLKPTCKGIECRGIRSVPSPVVNLKERRADLTVAMIGDAVTQAFEPDEVTEPALQLDELATHYASPEWIFDRTPRFRASGTTADGVAFVAEIVRGTVDNMDCTPASTELASRWTGRPFQELLNENPDLQAN